MPTNDFQAVADGVGATVLSQAAWLAYLAANPNGMPSGIVPATRLNKVIRQSSVMAAALAQVVSDILGADVLDADAGLAAIVAQIKSALRTSPKVLHVTRVASAASSLQNITGAGFQPRAAIVVCCIDNTDEMSVGMIGTAGSGLVADNNGNAVGTYIIRALAAYLVETGADYNSAAGALIADGISLNWIKTGAPSGTIDVYALVF